MRLSDAEWTVMTELWQASPGTARDVLRNVARETEWAYTTVKTILDRLVDKGALRVTKPENTSLYEPLVTREGARRSAIRSLLDRAFDGTVGSLLHHLVTEERMTKKDRQRLQEMLDDLQGGGQ